MKKRLAKKVLTHKGLYHKHQIEAANARMTAFPRKRAHRERS